jgi:hypothetical protein
VDFFGFPEKYGEAVADGSILVSRSFLQVQESSRCSLGFCVMFLRGPTWELKGYLLGLMDLDITKISGYS